MNLTDYARELRQKQTEVEKIIWRHLRNRQMLNCKFKRQFVLGRYIVDFVCLQINLVVEFDGGQHEWRSVYDKRRTKFLQSQGFEVLRYWNNQVLMELNSVLEDIYRQVKRRL